MSKKLKPLTDSSRYRSFISKRDKALEKLLFNTQLSTSDILRHTLHRVLEIISFQYPRAALSPRGKNAIHQIGLSLDQTFSIASNLITQKLILLRRRTYLLSKAGEAEAISRALGINTKASARRHELDLISQTQSDTIGALYPRVELSMSRIKRDIMDALEFSRVMESPLDETLARVKRKFPKNKIVKGPIVKLQRPKLTEGKKISNPDEDEEFFKAYTSIDQADWDSLVEEYKSEYVPDWRGLDPDLVPAITAEQDSYMDWDLERVITQDFVEQVRNGENDAAKENGIEDFQWIAIIDSKTDECCEWRDGLTTSEIQAQLDGEHSDDECDGSEPPIHMNCRCRLAPMTDSMPEVPPSNKEEFEDWLENPNIK